MDVACAIFLPQAIFFFLFTLTRSLFLAKVQEKHYLPYP